MTHSDPAVLAPWWLFFSHVTVLLGLTMYVMVRIYFNGSLKGYMREKILKYVYIILKTYLWVLDAVMTFSPSLCILKCHPHCLFLSIRPSSCIFFFYESVWPGNLTWPFVITRPSLPLFYLFPETLFCFQW